jgi:DNA repair exonuclease SbcCD ATPase subunit
MYEENLLSLSTDISEKENQLQDETTELERLTISVDKWQSEAGKLRQEIAELDAKVKDADQRASQSHGRAQKKRKNRWKWITATVFTAGKFRNFIILPLYVLMIQSCIGLASPGLIINEKDIQKLKRDRDAWYAQANERRKTLEVAENNHRDIIDRQQATEQSIRKTRTSLSSARTTLEELRKQYSVLSNLGAQIRNISTFLFSLNGELSVIHGQQQLMVLFQPLLESIDSLITSLESNVNTIVLIANKEAVNKIRKHLSPDFAKGLPTESSATDHPVSLAQKKIDHRIKKLQSEFDAKIQEFQLDSDARLKQFQLDSKKFFDGSPSLLDRDTNPWPIPFSHSIE